MEIPNIPLKNIEVRKLNVPEINVFDTSVPQIFTGYPIPITVNLGTPIVDVPGCVESRETDDLREVDPRGNIVFCDGNVPSFNPLNFEPNQKLPTPTPKVDTRRPEKPEPPGQVGVPQAAPPTTAKVDCPTPAQEAKEPVGTYVEGFRKKVTEYKLIGNECVQITEAVPIPQQIVAGLPAPGVVTTTATIAVVATASALMAKPLADILLKVVKPTVKKVMKKIATIRGKKLPAQSVVERQAEQRDRNQAMKAIRSVRPLKK
jgi:hypothetical protein